MAAIFPPDNYHGKPLRLWYREKTRELTGVAYIPENWELRVGLDAKTTITTILPKAYEMWDMRYELLSYATWRTYY